LLSKNHIRSLANAAPLANAFNFFNATSRLTGAKTQVLP
jgi:hypothetical protein